MTTWPPRPAGPSDLAPLAVLWHQCWHEAHAAITPLELVALRRPELFAERLVEVSDRLRVAGPQGAPLGLCIGKGDHLDRLYVGQQVRGTGLAVALLQDGEDRLSASGATDAKLDCAAQNHRAAHFYAREGWTRLGLTKVPAEAIAPPLLIDVILFGKRLTGSGPHSPIARPSS